MTDFVAASDRLVAAYNAKDFAALREMVSPTIDMAHFNRGFAVSSADDLMAAIETFSGGLMPSADTLLHFAEDLQVEQRWLLPGSHYEKTANHWLRNHDQRRDEVMAVLRSTYGQQEAALWHQRWRIFWMACAELFGYENGSQWPVAHYLFSKSAGTGRQFRDGPSGQ